MHYTHGAYPGAVEPVEHGVEIFRPFGGEIYARGVAARELGEVVAHGLLGREPSPFKQYGRVFGLRLLIGHDYIPHGGKAQMQPCNPYASRREDGGKRREQPYHAENEQNYAGTSHLSFQTLRYSWRAHISSL